jgi:hypothetical protein
MLAVTTTFTAIPVAEAVIHDKPACRLPADTTATSVTRLLGFPPTYRRETFAGEYVEWNFRLGAYLCGVRLCPVAGWLLCGPGFLVTPIMSQLETVMA